MGIPSVSLRLPANAASVREARVAVDRVARECGLSDLDFANVRLAVSEAVTNAIIHGARFHGEIRIEAQAVDAELLVTVADDGGGMRPRSDSPGLGLGLPVLAALTSHVEIVADSSGTELLMRFPCPYAA